jgi:hypothetical protein
MFDLGPSITDWRRQMLAAGIKTPVPLEELESHLREDIDRLQSSGVPDAQAFEVAVSRLGKSGSMQTEFKKVGRAPSDFATLASLVWIGAMILFALMLSGRLFSGKLGFLLFAHIFSLTAGYLAVFLTGAFGMGYVCCRWFRTLSPVRQQSLSRAGFRFSRLSAGLVIAGLLLGMFWSAENRGRYLTGDPREIGALCTAVWLIAVWLIQQFGQVSNRITMPLCIGSSMMVSLAWFGAGALAHGHGMAGYWPLDVLLGVQLVFLVMGLVPQAETATA